MMITPKLPGNPSSRAGSVGESRARGESSPRPVPPLPKAEKEGGEMQQRTNERTNGLWSDEERSTDADPRKEGKDDNDETRVRDGPGPHLRDF